MKNLFILFVLITSIISCNSSAKITGKQAITEEIQTYGLNNGDTLVDIGCGNGAHAVEISNLYNDCYFILEDVDVTIMKDINRHLQANTSFTKYIKGNYTTLLGTNDSIPLPNSAIGLVLCRKTLHEFIHPYKMTIEFHRILRQGGKLIVAEAVPLTRNQLDPFCKKKLLEKNEIEKIVSDGTNFKLVKQSIINFPRKQKLQILIFEKL